MLNGKAGAAPPTPPAASLPCPHMRMGKDTSPRLPRRRTPFACVEALLLIGVDVPLYGLELGHGLRGQAGPLALLRALRRRCGNTLSLRRAVVRLWLGLTDPIGLVSLVGLSGLGSGCKRLDPVHDQVAPADGGEDVTVRVVQLVEDTG
eukprot:scaffold101422_cov32-Tisochrysis_lutea.AAC.7